MEIIHSSSLLSYLSISRHRCLLLDNGSLNSTNWSNPWGRWKSLSLTAWELHSVSEPKPILYAEPYKDMWVPNVGFPLTNWTQMRKFRGHLVLLKFPRKLDRQFFVLFLRSWPPVVGPRTFLPKKKTIKEPRFMALLTWHGVRHWLHLWTRN